MERNIARCRLMLSVAALVAVYVDPAAPLLSRWVRLTTGAFVMDHRLAFVMVSHFIYSAWVYAVLRNGRVAPERIAAWTMWIDVFFGAAIGTLTEGETSPSFPFFAFAVVAAGLRTGLRQALQVTAASVAAYLCLILFSTRGSAETIIMRPVYLAITGYLVGFLGQQRLELQDEMRQLEAAEQRHRIARDLHDNFAQALAGINLRLEGCCRRLRSEPGAQLLGDLGDLQDSVKREYDQLRSYTRSLAGLEMSPAQGGADNGTRMLFRADLSASVDLVDHVLQIAREGIANVRRHARARSAAINIRSERSRVEVSIEDDGVGFQADAPPWSIASRVSQFGGSVEIVADQPQGAHLLITMPQD